MRKTPIPHHAAMLKHHSRLITTQLLLSLLNKGYYLSDHLYKGTAFPFDNRQINDRIFLKTIIRE